METEKYYVEIACNGSVLAERDTYEAAEKLVRQYEADDTSYCTYEPGYYAIRDVQKDTVERIW